MEPGKFSTVKVSRKDVTFISANSSISAAGRFCPDIAKNRIKMKNRIGNNLIFFMVFSLEIKNPAGLLTLGYLLTAPSHQK